MMNGQTGAQGNHISCLPRGDVVRYESISKVYVTELTLMHVFCVEQDGGR